MLAGVVVWATAPSATATEPVKLEALSTPGDSPFMQPVGQDQPNMTSPDGTRGSFNGDTPGLFAAEDDEPSCDTRSLVANLQADPARAAAWAQAMSIRTEDIPGFAQSLSPVLLRSDTAVTEHGYQPPTYASYPAVLQAGRPVFINGFGEPTVKCSNH